MKKYSLFIIIILAIIAVSILWLPEKKDTNDKINKEKVITENLKEIKENPSFNEVVAGGCCTGTENLENCNPYIGKRVHWKAMVSNYAHTGGIRFIVIDNDHSIESYKNHGLFYGTFLASADDPRITEEGIEKWNNKWKAGWVDYIMDTYGNIQDKDRKDDTIFLVSADISNVDCDKSYDGGYIETDVEKIEMTKN